MTETELERIVVRLVGDGSEYQKMLTDAATKTDDAAKHIESATRRIESMKNSLVGFGQQALSVFAGFGLATSLNSAFESFSKFEENQIRLKNTIAATGQEVGPTTQRFKHLADEISNATLVTKGEVFQLAQRATMMGLNAEKTEHVVKTAIALAGATGQDAEGMLRAAAAMERGNYQLAQRMIMGRGVKLSEEELHRVVTNMTNAGWKTQVEIADTAAGKIERLTRALKGISRDIGGMVSEGIGPFVQKLQDILASFNALEPATKKMITLVAGLTLGLGPLMSVVRIASSLFLGWAGILAGTAATAGLIWVRMSYGAEEAMRKVTKFWQDVKTETQNWVNYSKFAVENFGMEWERLKTRIALALASGFQTATDVFYVMVAAVRTGWSDLTFNIESTWVSMWSRLRNAARDFAASMGLVNPMLVGGNAASQLDEIARRHNVLNTQIRRDMVANMGGLNPRIRELRQELAALDRASDDRFGRFLWNQSAADRAARMASEAGDQTGEEFSKGMKHGLEKLDAALAFSSEAATRISHYRDALLGLRHTEGGEGGGARRSADSTAFSLGWLSNAGVASTTTMQNHLGWLQQGGQEPTRTPWPMQGGPSSVPPGTRVPWSWQTDYELRQEAGRNLQRTPTTSGGDFGPILNQIEQNTRPVNNPPLVLSPADLSSSGGDF